MNETDPLYHVQNVRRMLDDLIQHLRDDITKFDEPKAQARCETAAEVLAGLTAACDHDEHNVEAGMSH